MESSDRSNEMLSIRLAASATGLSPKAVRRRIERGTLDSVVVNGRRRIAAEELRRRGLLAPGADGPAPRVPGRAAPADAVDDEPTTDRLAARVQALERRVERLERELRRQREATGGRVDRS